MSEEFILKYLFSLLVSDLISDISCWLIILEVKIKYFLGIDFTWHKTNKITLELKINSIYEIEITHI